MNRSEAKELIEDILLESSDDKISDVAEDILTALEQKIDQCKGTTTCPLNKLFSFTK